MNTFERDEQYVAHTYRRFPVEIVSGKGSLVRDREGKEYIDMGAGIAVTSFGVADEEWIRAVEAQLHKVQHMSNLYYTEPCARLAEALCRRTGFARVFFSNSGAEANECAVKVARKWAAEAKGPDYNTIVTLRNSFHGRTLTTLAATGQDHFHQLFQPLTSGFVHVTPGDEEELERTLAENRCAAVLVELVQGEGGVMPLSGDYVRALEKAAEKYNVLLMVDEVQTGNGRTGSLYAFMDYGLKPDVVSTAKGLAGGLPLGATMMAERVKDVLGYGDHGSTFGGNPVACAAALSVLGRINETLLTGVRRKAALLREQLDGAPGIEAVAGLGLMIGLKTVRPAAEVVRACMEQGVLVLTAKDRVRLLPALNIPDSLLLKAAGIIREACAPAAGTEE